MDANLQLAYEQIMQAEHPEDLFGVHDIVLPADTLLEHLRTKYDPLRSATDPKMYQDPADSEAADDAHSKLLGLYAAAEMRIRQRIYGLLGRGRPLPSHAVKHFTVGSNRYHVGNAVLSDSSLVTYEGFLMRHHEMCGEVVIKVANTTASNHLLHNEARAIDELHRNPVPQWKHLPLLMDRFSARQRLGLVYRRFSGSTLTEVRRHRLHRGGVDQRHMVWILDRILSCLGYAHRCGLVHGALIPENVLIQPALHNVIIDGWGTSVLKPAVSGERGAFYSQEYSAPESVAGHVGPWSDIYSLGKLMIWLVGGDPLTKRTPEDVEPTIANLLRRMTDEDIYKRPQDAWDLHEAQNRVKDALWPRKFLHFDMT